MKEDIVVVVVVVYSLVHFSSSSLVEYGRTYVRTYGTAAAAAAIIIIIVKIVKVTSWLSSQQSSNAGKTVIND